MKGSEPAPKKLERIHRPRRLRRLESIRTLVRETHLAPGHLIYPMFLMDGENQRDPIETMPGQFRVTIDELLRDGEELLELGVPAVNLFGYCEDKDDAATASFREDGLIQRAVRRLKESLPELCVQTDIALDPYTCHGHDGLVIEGEVANDETVDVLCRMALSHAEAGVDWVAPSDMMDGRVGAIREALDKRNFDHVGILAYSAKYASGFYGPFRGALKSTPQKGDKKSYQMDPAN
ncbi:MAG: porphobilinogen synthase, partial [Verrucomicrobiota bacterium]